MDREDIIKFFESMSDDELKEKWEKYNEWSSEKMQSKLLLADVSKPYLCHHHVPNCFSGICPNCSE